MDFKLHHPPFLHRLAYFAQKKVGLFRQRYRQDFFGKTFVIPSINGRKTYVSEVWMVALLRKLMELKSGGVVDVGVNLGQTLLKVAAIDRNREYLGFEPNPTCSDYVFELIRQNELPYKVIPAGLGPETQVLQLSMYREEATDPSASLVADFRSTPVVGWKPVVVIGWADVPETIRPASIAIVKIDVEGGEKEVLVGLRAVIVEHRPFVLVEVLPAYDADNRARIQRQESIEKLLREVDYAIYRVRKDTEDQFVSVKRIEHFGIHGDLALSDYLLVHRDDEELIGDLIEP